MLYGSGCMANTVERRRVSEVVVNIRMPAGMAAQVRDLAEREERSMPGQIRLAISRMLADAQLDEAAA